MIISTEQHICDFCGSVCYSCSDCRLPIIGENGYIVCEERDICDSCKENLARISRLMKIGELDIDSLEQKVFDDLKKITTKIKYNNGKNPVYVMSKERMDIINSFK